jgi:hypothetical protein
MKKVSKTISALLLLSTLFASVLPVITLQNAKATNVSLEWGHMNHGNYDQDEREWEQYTCDYIDGRFDNAGYANQNAYWNLTTGTNVLNTIDWCQNNYAWATNFLVGDYYGDLIQGTMHYHIYGDLTSGQWDNINDSLVYSHTTGSRQYFTMVWTCVNGGCYWSDIYGNPGHSLYGFYDYWNGTGAVGMPLAWTHNSGLSIYGYNASDTGSYCYIGFENPSKPIKEYCEGTDWNYFAFVAFFYFWALYSPRHTIAQSLDYASNQVWGTNYEYTLLNRGYDDQGYRCYLRVFGNSNIYLP